MSQSQNIGFHFRNIVKFICVGIMAMDKITTHIFKFLYKSITTHYGVGGGGGHSGPRMGFCGYLGITRL